MRKCSDCGFEFDDDKNFCPSCGKYMPKIKNPYPIADCSPDNAFIEQEQQNIHEPAADIFGEEKPAFLAEEGAGADFEEPRQKPEHVNTPTTWSFVLSLFLFSVPVIGLIYMIVLAFGGTKYPAKKHLARAVFLYSFIVLVLVSAAVLIMMLVMGEEEFTLFINNLIAMNPLW